MSTHSRIEISPAKTEHIPGYITDTQSILLGGPCTGKTNICKSSSDITYINTIDNIKKYNTNRPIILDNAYQILSDPELDAAELITTLENHEPGVCYVFRPYELEWVVSQSNNINFDFESIQLLSLVYTREETISKLQRVDESLSESKIKGFVDTLEYEFSFTHAPIKDYHSYLPYCAVRASNAAVENIITGDSVTAKISNFAKQSDLSSFVRSESNHLPDLNSFARSASTHLPASVTATLSGAVGGGALASGVGAVALFAVLPILLNRTLHDGHEFERNLGRVLGHELFPHHQENLERETELPPRTFETLGKFADPVTGHHLDTLVEEQDELRSVIQESDICVEEDIDSLVELVDQLATETIPITELISEEFNNAVLPPKSLTQQQKDRITKELKSAADISETEAKGRVDDLFSKSLREEKLSEDYDNVAPNQGALLVYGEMGGGTTTFAQGLLEHYAGDGYDIGVVNSTTPEILRSKLRSMQSDSEGLALVYSVGRERSISPHNFQILFGEKVFEFYDVIIIECSQEQIDSIRASWEQTRDIRYDSAKSRLEPRAEIQLSNVDNEVLERIPRTLSSLDDDSVERIAVTADGNPTIAVEATLEALENGVESISGVRGREFIRSRLSGALQELQENHGEEPVDILVMLAAIRGVDDEKELANLLNISENRVKGYMAGSMSSYIHRRSDGRLVVSPRIYALTIFELEWFTELSGDWVLSDRRERFTERIYDSSSQNVVGLTTNLAELESTGSSITDTENVDLVLSCIEDILEQSGPARFPQVLAAVGIYQVPIQLTVLTDSNRLHESLYGVLKASDDESQEVPHQYYHLFVTGLAGVTIAAYHHNDQSAEAFLSLGTNLFREIVDTEYSQSELANLLIIRYYCGVLSPLVRTFDLTDVKPFVREVRQRAASIQNSSDVNDVFLVEFYSQILAPHVEVDEGPADYSEWLDFIIKDITDANEQPEGLTGLDMPPEELIAGKPRQFQTSPDRVVVQVFARAIITNPPRDPTDRLQWIEDTEARLKRFRSRLEDRGNGPTESSDEDEVIMSLPLWAAILGQLADFHSPDWADEWIVMAEQRLAEEFDRAKSSAHSQGTAVDPGDEVIHDGWARFVGDVIFEKRDVAEPGAWTERLVELVRDQVGDKHSSELVELRSYAWMLCRAVQSLISTDDEEFIETWVVWYFDHATELTNLEEIEANSDVVLTEPFVVAPECFQVDLQTNFVSYILKQLGREVDSLQYAVVGGCAHVLMSDNAPDSELFEWVYEIICTFIIQQDVDNFDYSIVLLYSKIIIYVLDLQNESSTQKISESVLAKLSEREGSEAVFDIVVLVMKDLSEAPFDEFGDYAKIVISTAMDHLSEEEQEELKEDLPGVIKSASDSNYVDEWVEGLTRWTQC